MLLADGHMVYNGPSKEVVPYFAKLGYKCPKYTNPAEFIRTSCSSSFNVSALFIHYTIPVVNLVKTDSYISSKEEGEQRLKHMVSAYRSLNRLPELAEDGSCYADELERSDPQSLRNPISQLAHSLSSWRRDADDEYSFGTPSRLIILWCVVCSPGGVTQRREQSKW